MKPRAYYNDNDPKTAAWLRELIRMGEIADGEVDDRSILDVRPDDIRGFTQCHFFAGIGGWPRALRLARWPDDRPVWTGSPPCQPFSVAGRRAGRDDARHLAPKFAELVGACRPAMLFGEQVASAGVFGPAAKSPERRAAGVPAGPEWAWLDDLFERLEAAHYACGASDIPSAGVGAPHIRQRCFFGAVRLSDADDAGLEGRTRAEERPIERTSRPRGVVGGVDDLHSERRDGEPIRLFKRGPQQDRAETAGRSANGGLADNGNTERRAVHVTGQDGRDGQDDRWSETHGQLGTRGEVRNWPNAPDSPWSNADWIFCRDGKWRPTEPAFLVLADGLPAVRGPSGAIVPASFPLAPKGQARRVMRLRGYGNAINPVAAAAFISAFEAAQGETTC